MLKNYSLIAVEGVIGVGKTTLAHLLTHYLRARPVLEKPQDNPFVERFYRDRQLYALRCQLSFLLQHQHDIQSCLTTDLFQSHTVTDFMLETDLLHAAFYLSEEEFGIYRVLYERLSEKKPKFDLVIYLQASEANLMQRIRHRGRSYDHDIGIEDIRHLARHYESFFHHYQDAPVLTINTDHFNFADNPDDFLTVVDYINKHFHGQRAFLGA